MSKLLVEQLYLLLLFSHTPRAWPTRQDAKSVVFFNYDCGTFRGELASCLLKNVITLWGEPYTRHYKLQLCNTNIFIFIYFLLYFFYFFYFLFYIFFICIFYFIFIFMNNCLTITTSCEHCTQMAPTCNNECYYTLCGYPY